MSSGQPVSRHSFALDAFQLDAQRVIDGGQSVIVSAPTGSGKTVVAEHAILRAVEAGRRAIYTTPIKALSNQKYRDLGRWLGQDQVGLLTGDNSIRGDAPVVVMTTEVLRNMLYTDRGRLADLDVVVMDEVHYLQDTFRGPVWEEVIIHLDPSVLLVALSATVSNADQLADWITSVHNPCQAIVETKRPVPLVNSYFVGEKGRGRLHHLPLRRNGKTNAEGRRFDIEASDQRGRRQGRTSDHRGKWRTPRRSEVINELARRDQLPAITFIFSRAGCDDAVRAVRREGQRLTSPEQEQTIVAFVEQRTAHLSRDDRKALGYDEWLLGLRYGLAAHHAGVVPIFKETVEELFVAGLLQAVFATETLALGVNMPARTVVLERLSKFTGSRHESLTPAEYTQLTGRAGRRGIDEHGDALVLWSPFATFGDVANLAHSAKFVLRSAFRPTFNMTCHLVERYTRAEATELIGRSFGQFQADAAVAELLRRREQLLARHEQVEIADVDIDQARRFLSKVRPGEVLRVNRETVAVLSSAFRRGVTRVRVIDTEGEVADLDPDELVEMPQVVGSIALPQPFNPSSMSHQHDVVGLLRNFESSRRSGSKPASAEPKNRRERRAVANAAKTQRRENTELARIDERIAERRGRLTDRFASVIELLTELGYIDAWTLTERGQVLLQTFHELDLVLVEALFAGLFDDHDAASLAGLVSCFVFESRKDDDGHSWFPNVDVEQAVDGMFEVSERVQGWERAHGLPASRDLDDGLFAATHGWAAGVGLTEILAEQQFAGGDFVRSMKQVIDLLSQIALIAPDPATRATALRARDGVQRGIVEASDIGDELAAALEQSDERSDEPTPMT